MVECRLGGEAVLTGVAYVVGEALRRAELGRGVGGRGAVHVGEDDPVTAGDHLLGDGPADAAGSSGDHDAGVHGAGVNHPNGGQGTSGGRSVRS